MVKAGKDGGSGWDGTAHPVLAFILACVLAGAANAADTVSITYLSLKNAQVAPSTSLDPPPADRGVRGAELAVADTNTTGQFTGQVFALRVVAASDADALTREFAGAIAAGQRLFVADLSADVLLRLADAPGAKDVVILDATTQDDRLRGADCRANTLHLLPSEAMLADALMQYLVTKNWTRIMLLTGAHEEDRAYAGAVRRAAAKFQIRVAADRAWGFNPAAQQADTGHFQVNTEVAAATQGSGYDVLVVADRAGAFGDALEFRTDAPRPVAGTQGLVPAAWAHAMDEYASTQLQTRFHRLAGRWMVPADYGAWLAVRAIGEAATRGGSADGAKIIAYLHSPAFAMSGYKGPELSFRAWDGQLRQPVLLATDRSLVSISPQPGFLHQSNELDTLGFDQPETECHFH